MQRLSDGGAVVVERWKQTAAGEVWKDGLRMLQIRLRNRFRVAIDRQRRLPVFSDGYFSTTMQRWIDRFRDFRRDSHPPSSAFYRKSVSKDLYLEQGSMLTRVLQAVAVPVLGNVCRVFMHGFNHVQIYGAEKLNQALLHRPANKSLITISNHVAAMDDPLVIASILPPSIMLDAHNLRWTLCATDRCFRNPVTSVFFKYLKVLPVSRGDGIYQKGMDIAISKLNQGEWIHIFPEGSRSRDGGRSIGPIKNGIGRLILDADNVPIVLPFVHTGMHEIMPIGAKLPRIGKTVTILIGDPINFDDILSAEENKNITRGKLYNAVCTRIRDRLQKLRAQVDRLAIEQSLQSQNYPSKVTKRSAGILQQVDWGSLSTEGYTRVEDYLSPSKQASPVESRKHQTLWEENRSQFQFHSESSKNSFSWGGGIVSRIHGYMDSTELMGLAAKGLFMNFRVRENSVDDAGVNPLKAWNKCLKSTYENQSEALSSRM